MYSEYRGTGALHFKPLPIDYEQCCSDQLNPQPKAAVSNRSKALFDNLVGERENAGRNLEAERAGRVEIDDKLNLRELQNRQVRRLCALEDARASAR